MSEPRRPASAAGASDPTPPPGSKPPAVRRKAAKAAPPDAAELQRQLADRDRRLLELTEQSLQILDRLAVAREELQQRNVDRARIDQLEQALQHARQRLRVAGRAVLGPDAAAAEFEMIVWGLAATAAPAVAGMLAAAPTAPATLLLRPNVPAAPFAFAHGGPLAVLETACQSPAAFWNHALSATQAAVVVFLTADVRGDASALARLATVAAAEGVAVASPVLRSGDQRLLGRVDRGVLEMAAQPVRAGDEIEVVPSASPEAFAISRRAFEQLGPFDQDLRGDLALVEWCLRAAAKSLRCVGVGGAEFALEVVRAPVAAIDAADRIVVLARHRPEQLAAGLLVSAAVWQQPPNDVAAVLRAAYRRLPLQQLPVGVELLIAQTQAVAEFTRAHAEMVGRLAAIAARLGLQGAGAGTEVAERVQGAVAALAERAEALRGEVGRLNDQERALQAQVQGRDAAIVELRQEIQTRGKAIELLQQEVQTRGKALESLQQEVQARGKTIESLQQEIQARGKRIESLQQEIRSRDGAIETLRQEIQTHGTVAESLRQEVHAGGAAIESLRAAISAHEQDLQARADELAAVREQVRQKEQAIAALQLDLQARSDAIVEIERKQTEREGVIGELRQEVGRRRTELEQAREQFSGALRDVSGLVGIREAANQQIAELERRLADATKGFDTAVAQVESFRTGNEELRHDHGTLQEQYVELAARAQQLVRTLGEREHWIAVLLQEVQRRRLFPRPLQQHEREFLARQRAPEGR